MPSDTDVLAELDLGEPPQELIEWARENINEDPETRCQKLEEFRDMIFEHWDPEKVSITEIFQGTMIVLELAILEQRAQILGGICIFDLGGLSMQQALYMTPSIAHKMVQIMVLLFCLLDDLYLNCSASISSTTD
ncbi:hypothetical protein NQ315_005902 [Exocentrus adspersus]|uniref:CRAL-TRIO domain-containing protein n=1 Tax=Exocentrus adspersus TaxID=1586481 RepID=A0AAV8VBY7_9CUCU|nr:hypothetical protein NQ315_005902 [Exocentrus adspersus]